MRLDKFLGHSTRLSRTECRRAIKAGAVSVNGTTATQAAAQVAAQDVISLHGETLTLPERRYLMLYKPLGYVCANTDADNPTVLDLLPEELQGLSIAGRLDKDTTGLVLLSDDGQWIHRVTAPRRGCHKHYQVTLDQPPTPATAQAFAEGLLLRGESKPTAPAELLGTGSRQVDVIISEGRYHQVKRMFAACGYHVLQLHRRQVGHVLLDPQLAPGDYRPLTRTEIDGF